MTTNLGHADCAWMALAAGVLAYEVLAPPQQLLSEAVDRYRDRHPALVAGMVVYVAAHLLRVWPRRVDPLHLIAGRAGR